MFRFEGITFDPDTGELTGARGDYRLQPKPARLLAMLLEARGELVEREQIRAALWPDTNVDFDAGLSTCVRQIRTALRQVGGDGDSVETLPKRGYRIIVADPAPTPATVGSSRRRYTLLTVAAVLMLAAAVAGWQYAGRPPAPADNRARLAVLPFNDPESAQASGFNRALTEAFVAALTAADPENLAVIGPATTSRMILAGLGPAEIAERAGAGFILMGGHSETDHVTFVQILVAPGAEHLFARRFDLDESRPAHAPAEIVTAITEAIRTAAAAASDPAGS